MKINNDMLEKAVVVELSNRIKDYRISKELTRQDLASRAFLSESTIKRFESGGEISLGNFIKILHGLGLTENCDLLIPDQTERPSFIASNNAKKQRVRKPSKKEQSWKWGDEK